jgi:hypothetical protein
MTKDPCEPYGAAEGDMLTPWYLYCTGEDSRNTWASQVDLELQYRREPRRTREDIAAATVMKMRCLMIGDGVQGCVALRAGFGFGWGFLGTAGV